MKKLNIPIFKCAVFFYAPSEMLQFERDYNMNVRDSEGVQSGNGAWVKEKNVGYIAHECAHLCDWLLHDRLDMGSVKEEVSELRAYIIEYFVKEFILHIDKKQKEKKGND